MYSWSSYYMCLPVKVDVRVDVRVVGIGFVGMVVSVVVRVDVRVDV